MSLSELLSIIARIELFFYYSKLNIQSLELGKILYSSLKNFKEIPPAPKSVLLEPCHASLIVKIVNFFYLDGRPISWMPSLTKNVSGEG